MQTDFSAKRAHHLINLSFRDLEKGLYPLSWQKALKARAYFLADLVIQATLLPFTLLKATYSFLEFTYTWGHKRVLFDRSMTLLSHSIHRILLSSLGAVLSPCLATRWKDENLFQFTADCLFYVLPNRLNFSLRSGFSIGWMWLRQREPLPPNGD